MELAIGSMVDVVTMMIRIESQVSSRLVLLGSGWETSRELYLLSSSVRGLGMNINVLCTFVRRFNVTSVVVSTWDCVEVS